MTLDMKKPEYWDDKGLDKELRRIFDICHGCRRCFNLCPSFDELFNAIDSKGEDVANLGQKDLRLVEDLCYQCKLCYNHCPYTPPHRFAIDFPRLMLRGKLIHVKTEGIPLRDRLMGNTDGLGKLGVATAPLANLGNHNPAQRWVMEKTLRIHREAPLPDFARQSFSAWFKSRKRDAAPDASNGKVALFYTCFINYYDPEVAKAAVRVLERSKVEVVVPEQRCCGMPYMDSGDVQSARRNAEANLKALAPLAQQGVPIVVPGPTCSLTLKQEYPHLMDSPEAQLVAKNTFDLSEYLMKLHKDGKLDTKFARGAGKVNYHAPCHLRAQNIGYKSRDLMQLLPDTTVNVVERCSGHDGTWGMKEQYFKLSLQVGQPLFDGMREGAPDAVVSDCPLACMQIAHATGRRPIHPIQVVAAAYALPDAKP